MKLTLSALPKTWIFDWDGLLVTHNGHLRGEDAVLDGVGQFWENVGDADVVILLTARSAEAVPGIRATLARLRLRVTHIIPECPTGERILFNDNKPSGLRMAHAVAVPRDAGLADIAVAIDPSL